MDSKAKVIRAAVLAAVLLIAGAGFTQASGPAQPSAKDKCPVCGMFVYKYPDWLAEMVFRDGSVEFFDGPKDLFKCYFNVDKCSPGKSRKDIEAIFVMEYYDLNLMDARKAFFVVGSDVYGPMGHELIPLATLGDAKVFMEDHGGKEVLPFEKITTGVVQGMD